MSNLSLSETEAARVASAKGGRRVSLADIEANIADRLFFTGSQAASFVRGTVQPNGDKRLTAAEIDHDVLRNLGSLTVCILILHNGFTVIGKSAPADPKNFDPELGRKLALEDAMRQCWPLMGYHLRQVMHGQGVIRHAAGLDGAMNQQQNPPGLYGEANQAQGRGVPLDPGANQTDSV